MCFKGLNTVISFKLGIIGPDLSAGKTTMSTNDWRPTKKKETNYCSVHPEINLVLSSSIKENVPKKKKATKNINQLKKKKMTHFR